MKSEKPQSHINFVVKNDFNVGGYHEDRKRSSKNSQRKQKHKKMFYNE